MSARVLSGKFSKLDGIERVRSHLKGAGGKPISVPGIVVVGAQSAGKSSVLEHATGLAFPRAEGTCTRVPTVVSVESGCAAASILVSTDPAYEEDAREIAIGDAEAFETVVCELTEKLAPNGRIRDAPIYVKYRRVEAGPTFTLTDVPGITFVPRNKAQGDIEAITRNLTRKLIAANDETLVLVVMPATEDFGNSAALKIAEEEDPEGKRTIGIVSKVDNLPPGSDLARRMKSPELELQHGYFAVRNRSQAEVEARLPLDELAAKEAALFEEDPVLSQLPTEQRGMCRLLDKLVQEQDRAVDAAIPKLRREVADALSRDRKQLAALPASLAEETERKLFVDKKLALFADRLRRCFNADASVLHDKDAHVSARVREDLSNMTMRMRDDAPDYLSEATMIELCEQSKEALGYNLDTFVQTDVFRAKAAQLAPLLTNIALETVGAVAARVNACVGVLVVSMFDSASAAAGSELARLFENEVSALNDRVSDAVRLLGRAEGRNTFTLNHYLTQTIAKFDQITAKYQSKWTANNLYTGMDEGGDLIPSEFMARAAAHFCSDSNEAAAIRKMQVTLHAYAKVVHKRFSDSVAVLMRDGLLEELADKMPALHVEWAPSLVAAIKEDKGTARKRKELQRSIDSLQKALRELERL